MSVSFIICDSYFELFYTSAGITGVFSSRLIEMLRNLCDDGLQVREPSGLLDLRRLWRAAAAAARAAAERAAERVVGGGE